METGRLFWQAAGRSLEDGEVWCRFQQDNDGGGGGGDYGGDHGDGGVIMVTVQCCVQVSTSRRVQGLVKKSRWVRSMQVQGPKWFLKAFALARKRRKTAFDHT